MDTVAISARERVYGLPKDLASHEKAGTVLGRLWLQGKITEPMRQAGEKYLEIYESAMKAINAPMGLRTRTVGDSGDVITEDYVEWATAAVGRYEALKACLCDKGCFGSIQWLVVEDEEPYIWPLAEIGLTHLAERLGIDNQ